MASVLSTISEKFFLFFPTLREPYKQTHILNNAFARIEKVAFAHFPSYKQGENASASEERERVIQQIQAIVYNGVTLKEWMQKADDLFSKTPLNTLYKHEQAELQLLKQQLIALKYRSGAECKGGDESQGQALYDQIAPIIRLYVYHPSINPGRHEQGKEPVELNSYEKQQLLLACTRYPLLMQELLDRHAHNKKVHDTWTADFVKWALRSGCNVGVFVKTPLARKELSSAHLDKRSGAIHNKKGIHFKTKTLADGRTVKILCMMADGTMQPIQGEHKTKPIHLKNRVIHEHKGITLTMEQIIQLFKEKTTKYGDVEYLASGISNWNAIRLASFNDDTKTYDTLPPGALLQQLQGIAPVISLSQAQLRQRYELSDENPLLEDGQRAFAMRANRQKPDLNVLEAHGYFEVVHRIGDNYSIFPMGVQPTALPSNPISKLFYLAATNVAALHYPDEALYLSQRQHTTVAFIPLATNEEARLHKVVQSLYQKGQTDNLVFQFGGINCAYHVQKVFDNVMAAPFYRVFRKAMSHIAQSKTIFKEIWTEIQLKKALEGLNHEVLDDVLTELIKDLLEDETSRKHLQHLLNESVNLINHTFQKDLKLIDLKEVDLSQDSVKKDIKQLLFQTVMIISFYRLDLFESHSDNAILDGIHKIIKILPWRWLKRFFVNLMLFLLGSFRWQIIEEENIGTSTGKKLVVKSLLNNDLIHESYLHHPAAAWKWKRLHVQELAKFESIRARLCQQSATA